MERLKHISELAAAGSMAEAVFRSASAFSPRNKALSFYGFTTSFSKLGMLTEKASRVFAGVNISRGDKVLICLPNVPAAVVALYALNLIGAVAVFVHPLSAEDELSYYIEDSAAKLVVTMDMFASKFKTSKVPVVTNWNRFMRGPKVSTAITADSRDVSREIAVILYSGGTTGFPKGIQLTNANFNSLAEQTFVSAACITRGEGVMLAVLPMFHGFGLGICVHTALYFGMTVLLIPRFSVKAYIKAMKRSNYIAGVPTLFESILKADTTRMDLSKLKGVFCGGDSLSGDLQTRFDAFLEANGAAARIREGYGLTECVTACCLTPKDGASDKQTAGHIGLPYPETLFRIVEPGTHKVLPNGAEGEITISGPTVMSGYLGKPELSAETLKADGRGRIWLYTGDLGHIDDKGYVYFKQRLKRVIISSGYNVYPSQLERVIGAVSAVEAVCVVGVPHEYKVSVPKAFVVLKQGSSEVIEEFNIRVALERGVAKYARPKDIVFLSELPRTSVGKIDYGKLENYPAFTAGT
ncbi:MAG: AMP-binding protein [Oscillospiraceae bacterium]|jgi:long-chain acyl-CoA synthetase|nr:AMP-binding protein [Oscillospiraceae bacterium]